MRPLIKPAQARQPGTRRLSGYWRTKVFKRRRGRYVKKAYLPFGLEISFRSFKTSRVRHSPYLRVTLPVYFLPIREVAVKRVRRNQLPQSQFIIQRVGLALMMLGFISLAYFSPQLISYKQLPPAPKQPQVAIKAEAPTPITAPQSVPTRLKIPAIGLEATINTVGLNKDGTMEVPDPNLKNTVGWYKYSPTPGELGPSIIVGHVVDYVGPSVFWHLQDLHPGDEFTVDREDSSTLLFKVNSIEQYSQEAFPTDKVYSNINFAGIRLITCGGVYNPKTGHYTLNTVVYGSYVGLYKN